MDDINDLMCALLELCPDGEFGEDNYGQLVFYTGLYWNEEEGQ
jgi:hypothetical protein